MRDTTRLAWLQKKTATARRETVGTSDWTTSPSDPAAAGKIPAGFVLRSSPLQNDSSGRRSLGITWTSALALVSQQISVEMKILSLHHGDCVDRIASPSHYIPSCILRSPVTLVGSVSLN